MKNEVELLKEKCFALEFKNAVQIEIEKHQKSLHRIEKKIMSCKNEVAYIDKQLRKMDEVTRNEK